MVDNGGTWTAVEVGTVKVYKAGGELHVTLNQDTDTNMVGFGDRIWSEYVAVGANAHTGRFEY